MYGLIIQVKPDGWREAIQSLPPGTPIKAFEVQVLREAKAVNPGLFAILRSWYDPHQIFGTTDQETLRGRAREFLNTFIDGTYRRPEHADAVDAVEGWNEYNANGHSPDQVREREAWVRALCEVWAGEYQSQSDLSHTRIICGNVAVGNDLPLGAARSIYETGQYAGYHAYVAYRKRSAAETVFAFNRMASVPKRLNAVSGAFRESRMYHLSAERDTAPHSRNTPALSRTMETDVPSGVHPADWESLSGRFATMDQRFRQEGIYLHWMITEIGSVLYGNGGAYLDPYAGWRHPDVHGGDVGEYLQILRYWHDRTMAWNRRHGDRVRGPVLFVAKPYNREDTWHSWTIQQPEMSQIMEEVSGWGTSYPVDHPRPGTAPPEPEPDPPEENGECRGTPRVQYGRHYYLIDSSVPDHLAVEIFEEAYQEKRRTVGWSFDDAGIGDLDHREVTILGAPEEKRDLYTGWFAEHYPGVQVDYKDVPTAERLLRVDPLSQRDSRWSDYPLGEDTGHGKTIGSWGCLLVAYNMMARYLGLTEMLPPAFNDHFVETGAMSRQFTLDGALATAYPDRVEYGGYLTRADNETGMQLKIEESLKAGIPVPAEVDFVPQTAERDQHWVLIIGIKDGAYMMVDPWYGDIGPLSRYGSETPIQAVFYTLKNTA